MWEERGVLKDVADAPGLCGQIDVRGRVEEDARAVRDAPFVGRDEAAKYRAALSEWTDRQKAAQKKLSDYLADQKKLKPESAKLSDDAFRKTFNEEQKALWDSLKKSLDEVEKSKPSRPLAALAIILPIGWLG